jgi:phycocyanobilin:ferredoxin oxidoreductase
MSIIFNKLKAHALELEKVLSARAFLLPQECDLAWTSRSYNCAWFRRANIDVIDAIDTKGLWMMHLCVFPHVYDGAPVYGFDIIAGKHKVTGAFLDFSPINPEHKLLDYFEDLVEPMHWDKTRELPDWAKRIFSPSMLAVGNINSEFELEAVLELSKKSLEYYIDSILKYRPPLSYDELVKQYNYTEQQNYYCQQQKQNPHTPKVLKALGFSEEMIYDFIHKELFPELVG